jgi:hypothetical protein
MPDSKEDSELANLRIRLECLTYFCNKFVETLTYYSCKGSGAKLSGPAIRDLEEWRLATKNEKTIYISLWTYRNLKRFGRITIHAEGALINIFKVGPRFQVMATSNPAAFKLGEYVHVYLNETASRRP